MLTVKVYYVYDNGNEWTIKIEAPDWEEVNDVIREMVVNSDGEIQIIGVEEII